MLTSVVSTTPLGAAELSQFEFDDLTKHLSCEATLHSPIYAMRLLRFAVRAQEWRFVDFHGKSVPFYAILSHTWGPDDESCTFEHIQSANRDTSHPTLPVNRKLDFVRLRALEDGLNFFWVDTCCIKKSDSAELQRSLNSMFYWYQQAARCYVWLEDVSDQDCVDEELPWKTAFSKSRWFKRGWTLQELIAPKSVVFCSKEGTRLGDKHSLAATLAAVTGIPTTALLGTDLSRFSKEARLSWANGRETKVPEDAAYSLIGIFEVTLPMMYADGKYAKRKQAALDELDIAIERTSGRNKKPPEVVRVGGASYEDLRTLEPRQMKDLGISLKRYIDWLDKKFVTDEEMTSEELLESRMVNGTGFLRLQAEEELQDLLKSYGVAYDFEVHYNQPRSFDIHNASSFDKLRWLEDAWHIFGFMAAKTVLDLKIWIESNDLQ